MGSEVKSTLFDGKQFPAFKTIADDAGNTEDASATVGIVRDVTVLDCSADQTAEETAIVTVPADSIIFNVYAEVLVPMDGDTTTTLEVGLTGNIDKYIDTVDFDPSAAAGTQAASLGGTTNDQKVALWVAAAEAIVATWTNTTTPGAGSVRITVVYLPLA